MKLARRRMGLRLFHPQVLRHEIGPVKRDSKIGRVADEPSTDVVCSAVLTASAACCDRKSQRVHRIAWGLWSRKSWWSGGRESVGGRRKAYQGSRWSNRLRTHWGSRVVGLHSPVEMTSHLLASDRIFGEPSYRSSHAVDDRVQPWRLASPGGLGAVGIVSSPPGRMDQTRAGLSVKGSGCEDDSLSFAGCGR